MPHLWARAFNYTNPEGFRATIVVMYGMYGGFVQFTAIKG